MAYRILVQSGQTYRRNISCNVQIEWTDAEPHRPNSGAVFNNVSTSVAVYATLREAFDALAVRLGRIVMYVYQDAPWGVARIVIDSKLPDCPNGACIQVLARRTPNGTSYSDAIDDAWLS